ncbi:STAS domain-containing protein [Micromonosporaceae bacterium Da 78-11]
MTDSPVEVETQSDGTLVVHPHGYVGPDSAAQLRQLLVHAVRHLRPHRLVLDLRDVSGLDPINLGTLVATCGLGDDHRVAVFVDHSSPDVARRLAAAGIPDQRMRHIALRNQGQDRQGRPCRAARP